MSDRDYLFWGQDLRDYLEGRLAAIANAVEGVPEEHVMQADAEAWAEALAESHEVQIPELGETWMDKPVETKVDVSYDHFSRAISDPSTPTYVPGWRVTFHIPFEGDPEVFERKTSTWTTVLCDGAVRGSELIKTIEYPADTPADLDAQANGWRQDVEKWLGYAVNDINGYANRFVDEARRQIADRRSRIEAHRDQLAKTKTPIGPPEDRDKVSIVEAVVRRPSPVAELAGGSPSTAGAVELEPALQAEVFDHVLQVIRDTGQGMEKTPKTYADLDEEARRDVFVNNLNTHYRGQTSAEAFNRSGHTDILVTYENKSLFIGECKIWHGAKSLTEAMDQLFTYTAWRDTKTALVFFVGEKGFGEIVGKAKEALAAHPQFKAWQDESGETEFRATMTWPGDDQREIDLALTLFQIETN